MTAVRGAGPVLGRGATGRRKEGDGAAVGQ